jgi:putative transcriptional regulator
MAKFMSLKGKLLIAMPSIEGDVFNRSVVYICSHNADGAMGLVINKPASDMIFADLVEKLDVQSKDNLISQDILQMQIFKGGPVKKFQGFVLHSSDYFSAGESLKITKTIALTATVDVLRDIAKGEGPKQHRIALGYAGWSPGQLENEIIRNGWLHCEAGLELMFGQDPSNLYAAALRNLGVDPLMLSSEAGHA